MEKITNMLNHDLFVSLTILAGALTFAAIAYIISRFVLKKFNKKILFNKVEVFTGGLLTPLRFLFPSGFVLLAVPMLKLPNTVILYISSISKILFILSIGWFVNCAIYSLKVSFLSMYDVTVSDNLKARSVHTQVKVIKNIIATLIVLFTISFILMSFENFRQIGTSLLGSVGILGIVVGLGAQKTVGNFIAGIQLAFTQPIRVDDVVIVENEWGRIEEITLTFVVVRIWDLRRLVLPISYFLERPFQNWTRSSADILGSVFIYADYSVPIEKIREELTRILQSNPLWNKKVNVLQVTDAKEHTLEIRALMSAADASKAWDLRCAVREKLVTFLQKSFPDSLPKTRVELSQKVISASQ
ncbi:MAG: mechanosensitive ion channel [Candidatus Omnitrophica bacterium]|nr:mechanosensitive ion channel [Candidatus Omnitrophota bacterium]